MVKNADLLSLQLGHWTFVLGGAEQTNVRVLTHWKQTDSQNLKQKVLCFPLHRKIQSNIKAFMTALSTSDTSLGHVPTYQC